MELVEGGRTPHQNKGRAAGTPIITRGLKLTTLQINPHYADTDK